MNHKIINLSSLEAIIFYNKLYYKSSKEDFKEDFKNNPENWGSVFKSKLAWDELTYEEQQERKDAFFEALEEM